MRKRLILLAIMCAALVGAFTFLLYRQGGEHEWSPPAQGRYGETLHVVSDANYPPLSFLDEDGQPAGHDVELIYALAEELEVNIELTLLPWSELLEQFRAGRYDLLLSATYTPLRTDWISYSRPIFSDSYTVFGRDEDVEDFAISQLYTARLAFLRGDAVRDTFFSEYLEPARVYDYPNLQGAFSALREGRCDYVVAPRTVGLSILREMGLDSVVSMSDVGVYNSIFCFGAHPEDAELLERVNTALGELSRSGELAELRHYWMEQYPGTHSLRAAMEEHPFLFIAILVIVLLAVCLLLLFHELRRGKQLVAQAEKDRQLLDLRTQMEMVLRGISGGFAIIKDDEDKTFVYIGPSLSALIGYTVEDLLQASANTVRAMVPEEDFAKFFDESLTALGPGDNFSVRFRARCRDGSLKWISTHGKIVEQENGERVLYTFNHDVTELEEIQQQMEETAVNLRQERRLYRDALLHNCEYAYIVNVSEDSFHYLYNTAFLEKYDFDPKLPCAEAMERLVATMSPVILTGREDTYLPRHFAEAFERGEHLLEVEYHIPSEDSYKKKMIFLSKDDVTGDIYACVVARDISAQQRDEMETRYALARLVEAALKIGQGNLDVEIESDAPGEVGILADVMSQTVLNLRWHIGQLQAMAAKDAMTGVKNKRAWQTVQERVDEDIRLGCAEFAVVVCDVNGLKKINDTYGHEAGDRLIIRACKRICRVFSHSPVFRVGGDEFVVLLEKEDLANCDRLLEECRTDTAPQEDCIPSDPPASIAFGLSRFHPGEDESCADVFRRADAAMYENKALMKAK